MIRDMRSGRRRREFVATRSMSVVLGLLALAFLGACQAPKRVGPGVPSLGPRPFFAGADAVVLRVGMGEDLPTQSFTCTGPFVVAYGPDADPVAHPDPADTLHIGRQGSLLVMDGETAPAWLIVAPVDADDTIVWDGRRWRGEFHMIPTQPGHGLTVINVVGLEDYLAGVVPREIGNGRGREDLAAVEAQTVAARTYSITRLASKDDRGFDLYADIRDQAYGGVDWEDPLCNEAIAATAGLVLWHGSSLAQAFYHSTCGGHTACIQEVWPSEYDPLLQGSDDRRPDGKPWCAASRYAQWREVWTWKQLETVLAVTLPEYLDYVDDPARAAWSADVFTPLHDGAEGQVPGGVRNIAVIERTSSGRVAILEITTAAGIYRVRGDRVRWVLRPPAGGPTLLRSSWFELSAGPGGSVAVAGRGWGHGLGLCQMGALGRSRAGQDAKGILTHYYPGSRLAALDDGPLP